MKRIIVIGGGLGGLISAILLTRKDFQVTLFEKKKYPFHRVCGEYVSNEVKDFLIRENLFPKDIESPQISEFLFTSTSGNAHQMRLDLGAFGISRYRFDHWLSKEAINAGVELFQGTTINDIEFTNDVFHVKSNKGDSYTADFVIGAYGKNSGLDKKLNRPFTKKRNPYIGVKYHLKTDFPKDLIALHNFESGYCGISAIEEGRFNMCYLGNREMLRKHGSIEAMESKVLKKNPYLNDLLENSDFLFDKPEVINEFSFAPKSPIENHIFMIGDAAGLITPLCGNGMAMAIHSAKIIADMLIEKHHEDRINLEWTYAKLWQGQFARRLWVGRQAQKLFGSSKCSEIGVHLMKNSPWLANAIMRNTHGQPI